MRLRQRILQEVTANVVQSKKTQVVCPEEMIRQYALRRIAEIFGVSKDTLSPGARFGQELKAAPASDFKSNQFDIIDGDLKEVADKQLLKKVAQGTLVIRTVGDYCEHMVDCSRIKPEQVASILRLPDQSMRSN